MSIEGVFSATLKWKNKRETKEKEGRIMSDKDFCFSQKKKRLAWKLYNFWFCLPSKCQ